MLVKAFLGTTIIIKYAMRKILIKKGCSEHLLKIYAIKMLDYNALKLQINLITVNCNWNKQ